MKSMKLRVLLRTLMKLLNSRNYGERKCRGNRQKNWLVWLFRYATVEKMLWLWFSFICMLRAMKLEDCTVCSAHR